MAIPPRKRGIQRLDEGDRSRPTFERLHEQKIGKTCVGCQRYFNYLHQTEKLCLGCKSRRDSLKK